MHLRHCKADSGAGSAGGFSLLELLVALAIVTAVAGLGWLSMQSATRASRSSRCLSNLRQWGVVFSQFTSDNQGNFPPSFPFGDGRGWYHALGPLVKNYILNGSEADGPIVQWNAAQGINGCPEHPRRYSSYAYSFHLGNLAAVGRAEYRGKLTQIVRPSLFLMLADTPLTGPEISGFSRSTPERFGPVHGPSFNALYVDGHVENHTALDPARLLPE